MEVKPCGLISVIPPALQQEWAGNMAGLVRLFRPAAVIFRDPAPAVLAQAIAGAKPLELAVLVAAGGADGLSGTGASGVYLNVAGADCASARAAFGSSGIIGAACGLSRHAAMECAETGADFIVFDATDPESLEEAAELSAWWDEITGVPVALDLGRAPPDRSVIAKARPDFLMIHESDRAGESLIFATEFGLQSQA
jgi:thiamine-phosphate pyrophosphorylase